MRRIESSKEDTDLEEEAHFLGRANCDIKVGACWGLRDLVSRARGQGSRFSVQGSRQRDTHRETERVRERKRDLRRSRQ